MMRLSSSRNQRSKVGFRLKYFLQICLLLAICTWLLYQLKHSYSKKRAFEERITKITTKLAEQQPDFFAFRRKGLPLVKENDSMSRTGSKDEDIEEGQEEEGEQEHDMKWGEAEDEEGKDVDDPIDELDRDGGGQEKEQAEDFTSEEEKDGHVEEESLFDDQEHEESVQEAREENYKRDDVSSAVPHDTHAIKPEIESEDVGPENVEERANGTVDDANSNNNSTLADLASMSSLSNVASKEKLMVPEADLPMKGSYSEAEGKEVELSKPENGSLSTSLSAKGSNQKELQPNTTAAALPENNIEVTANMSYSQMRIQKNPSLVYSVSTTREDPQHESSGKTDTSKGHEPDDHPTTSE